MTDKIRPRHLPRQVWIETDNDEGFWADINPATGKDIPTPYQELPENLRFAWKDAKQPTPSPEIIQALFDFTTDYMIEAQFDQTARNAYPGQVRKYVSEVEKPVTALQKLIDPNLDPKVENHDPIAQRQQTIIRHMTTRAKGAFLLHDLTNAAEAFKAIAIELRDSMDEGKRGSSGTQVPKARKELFASRLHEIFKEYNLPTNTSEGALMPVVLGLCLEAAGEKESRNPEAYFLIPAGTPKTD